MADLNRLGTGDKLIMQMLVGILIVCVGMGAADTEELDRVVDFVEGQPVMNQALELGKAGGREADKMFDRFSVQPAAAMFFQIQRCVEMPDRDQRFDSVLVHFLEHVTVEFNTFLERCLFQTCREQA